MIVLAMALVYHARPMSRVALLTIAALALSLGAGCSLVTVEQEPFAPLQIRAKRPPPPPARVVLTASSIKINDKVQFAFGKADIDPVSFGLLDEVAKVLVDNEQIEVIQIEGHTDNIGSASINKTLSANRAKSVMKYLADKGVAAKRMTAKGFGPDKPIADNATKEGQDANRRVEFNILKQGPKKTLIQDE
jgi:outer membrane protein OmpA-like peptidoglycan-associated protein